MSGIYIKGLKLPKYGQRLRMFVEYNGQVIIDKKEYFEEYEAIAVPDHGDLIERDAAYDSIAEKEGGNYIDMDAVYAGLQDAPTVIPADKEET